MLEDERAHGVGVALGAYRKLARRRTQLPAARCLVRVVAVAALNQSNINAVPVRSGKLRLLCSVTTEAEGGLRLDQQEVYVGRSMRIVAGCAAQTVLQVLRLGKVLRFQAGLVAA
jgi:hypothetical protein